MHFASVGVEAHFASWSLGVKIEALQCRCWRPLAAGAMQPATYC